MRLNCIGVTNIYVYVVEVRIEPFYLFMYSKILWFDEKKRMFASK